MFFKTRSFAFRFIEAFGYTDTGRHRAGRRNCCALSFRLKAVNTVFEWKGGRAEVETGDICFAPAGLEFSRTTEHDAVLVVHFELFGADFANIEIFTPSEPRKYQALFEQLLATYEKNAPDRDCACSSILYRILGEICVEKADESRESRELARIRPAHQYIQSHYCDADLTVTRLAALCHMSEVYFRRNFEKEFGVSPKKYITALRIRKAISLLEAHDFTVAEVAERTGFCDAKYFSSVFRRVTGKTPSRYGIEICQIKSRWGSENS